MEQDLDVAREAVMATIRGATPERMGQMLRALMASAAAGLTALEGERAASEAAYRLADAVIGTTRR